MRRSLCIALTLAVGGLLGCDGLSQPGLDGDDTAVDTEDQAAKDDSERPLGAYRRVDGAGAGDITLLVLKDDWTFHREIVVTCVRAPCPPLAQKGTYKLSRSGNTRYLRFLDDHGKLIDRYAYRQGDGRRDGLGLRLVGTREWLAFEYDAAGWCEQAADCMHEGLIHIMCLGQWSCQASACSYDCGYHNECMDAGGECVAVTPDSCKDGTPSSLSCGGGLGVGCCLPKADCQPVMCELYCEYGFAKDARGCEICKCAAAPTPPEQCQPVTCELYCQNGFATDERGCPICKCAELPQPTPCGQAGGECVAVYPGSCENGYVGTASDYSCGGGLGTMCCLPAKACTPKCDAIGSRSEGWYNPCTGELLCWANCASAAAARCDAIGSRSEGWYTDDTNGCNGSGLIRWANCSD